MPELWDTADLMDVTYADEASPPDGFWLGFYPREFRSEKEEIYFDAIMPRDRRLAPFVAPNVQGRVMRSRGRTLKSFAPAYVKPKHVVDPTQVVTRRVGEPISTLGQATMSLEDRWDAAGADNLREEREMIERRWDWMACQAAVYGAVTVAGEDYPTQTVDFGRHASLTYLLTGTAQWDDALSSPLADIKAGRINARERGRSRVSKIIFGSDAWTAFSEHADVMALLDKMKSGAEGTTLDRTGITDEIGAEYVGRIGGPLGSAIEMWIYSNDYEEWNADGTVASVVPYMDPRDVVGIGAGFGGVRAFGAIKDKRAGLHALPMFPMTYDSTNDVSATWTVTQSAPLMVPTNPDNTFRIRAL